MIPRVKPTQLDQENLFFHSIRCNSLSLTRKLGVKHSTCPGQFTRKIRTAVFCYFPISPLKAGHAVRWPALWDTFKGTVSIRSLKSLPAGSTACSAHPFGRESGGMGKPRSAPATKSTLKFIMFP